MHYDIWQILLYVSNAILLLSWAAVFIRLRKLTKVARVLVAMACLPVDKTGQLRVGVPAKAPTLPWAMFEAIASMDEFDPVLLQSEGKAYLHMKRAPLRQGLVQGPSRRWYS